MVGVAQRIVATAGGRGRARCGHALLPPVFVAQTWKSKDVLAVRPLTVVDVPLMLSS